MSVTNPNHEDRLRWICNTSSEDGQAEIKRLLTNPDIPNEELRDLFKRAMAYEIHGAHRKSLIVALRSALKRFTSQPVTSELVPPSWDRARDILSGIKLALRLSIAGQVMLGMELQDLKKALGFVNGRNQHAQAGQPQKTWAEHVKEELGISRPTADRMIDMWEAAKPRLKKLGGAPLMLGILETPPAALDAIQRQSLEAAVAKITDGETQKSLLEELKLVKLHDTSGIGGDTSAHRQNKTDEESVGQLAFAFFSAVAEPLQNLRTIPDRAAFFIAMAEQHPQELTGLEQLLESTLHDVRAAKARRIQPSTKH